MKLRNVLTVLGTAAVTAALTLMLFAPRGDSAQAGPIVQPVIAQPQLTSQGCTFTLKTDKVNYEAGQSPKIEVKAINPTNHPINATVSVIVTATSPTSRMSRMLPIPTIVWSHEFAFNLAPDETKSLNAGCAPLPAGGSVSITLSDQNTAVLAGQLGLPNQGGINAQVQNTVNAVPVAGGPNGADQNAVRPQD